MNDETTSYDTTDEPSPPLPGGPTGPPRLRRSDYDRMISGVSGGIGEHFGIDPIIVRLGFVALTLLGGSGIGLYLLAWLVMPDAHEDESAAVSALRTRRRPRGRSLFALGLLLLGVIVFSGSFFWFPGGDELFLPLLVLAAGIALLVWPSDGTGWRGRQPGHGGVDGDRDGDRDSEVRPDWQHGYRQGFHRDEPAADVSEPQPPRPRHRRRRRPTPFLGPVGLALVLLFTGLTVFADRVDWWHTDPGAFLAICLMILGAVLVVSAFVGRARGLVWLGLLLLPIAWAITAVDLTWWEGIGEELVVVDDLGSLDDEYRWGVGEFHVNLADLDLDGETRELAIGLTIGELKIWVPETFETDIDLDGNLGSVIIDDQGARRNDDGHEVAIDRTTGDPSGGTLLLDVDLGIGEAEVIICGSETVPCP
ncbi:MAG: PspC domain-containing protein [Acidimicrobiales bacterium]